MLVPFHDKDTCIVTLDTCLTFGSIARTGPQNLAEIVGSHFGLLVGIVVHQNMVQSFRINGIQAQGLQIR